MRLWPLSQPFLSRGEDAVAEDSRNLARGQEGDRWKIRGAQDEDTVAEDLRYLARGQNEDRCRNRVLKIRGARQKPRLRPSLFRGEDVVDPQTAPRWASPARGRSGDHAEEGRADTRELDLEAGCP